MSLDKITADLAARNAALEAARLEDRRDFLRTTFAGFPPHKLLALAAEDRKSALQYDPDGIVAAGLLEHAEMLEELANGH